MKTILLLVALLLCQIAFAQEPIQAMERLNAVLIEPTEKELLTILHPDLNYGHSNGILIDTRATLMQSLLSGASDYQKIDVSNVSFSVSGKTAWVRHKALAHVVSKGTPQDINMTVLLTFVKIKGQWQLYARQTARLTL